MLLLFRFWGVDPSTTSSVCLSATCWKSQLLVSKSRALGISWEFFWIISYVVDALFGLGPLCHCCISGLSTFSSRTFLPGCLAQHCPWSSVSWSICRRPIRAAFQNFHGPRLSWRCSSCATPRLHGGTSPCRLQAVASALHLLNLIPDICFIRLISFQ